MSNTEIQSKVNELRELRRMADELTAEIESIQDSTAFKKAMPELAERFTKSTTSRRFTVA